MFHVVFLLIFFTPYSYSSIAEFYGADAKGMALAGQSNYHSAQANYYGAATLAFVNKNQLALSFSDINMKFDPIENIVISNPVNSQETGLIGDADVDYPRQQILSVHADLALFSFNKSRLGLSLFMPINKVFEMNTADSYRPHYTLYQSRFLRTQIYTNYIQPLSNNSSFSVGALTSFNSQGETYVLAQENGADQYSSAKMNIDAQFNFSLLLSFSHKWNKQHQSFISYQEKTQSNLTNRAQGLTPIGSASLAFDWKMQSQLYFDPAIYRISHSYLGDEHKFVATLEYQDWNGYEGPGLALNNQGGILASSLNSKNFRTHNIFIPRLAYEYKYKLWAFTLGYAYRPTPLKLQNSAAGNVLDLNSTTYALGLEKRILRSQQDFAIYLAGQYNQLNKYKISKGPGLENGLPGDKIGSPGYTAGGAVLILSTGINWNF